jgi:hypothetical protein
MRGRQRGTWSLTVERQTVAHPQKSLKGRSRENARDSCRNRS